MVRAKSALEGLPRTIWYMGAKARVIDGFLARVLERLLPRGGSVLDLFSGSGVVAAFCARRYQVLANDVQRYAYLIARSLIERPPGGGPAFSRGLSIDRDLLPAYLGNRARLHRLYREPLLEEDRLLRELEGGPARGGARALAARYRRYLEERPALYGERGAPAPLADEESIEGYRRDPLRRPACLLTTYYAHVYYGLRQAIDLDSLRSAIEDLAAPEGLLERKRVHYLSALLHTASVTTSGTSHFAQPRQLEKDSEVLAMAARRRIDILSSFRRFSEEIAQAVAALDLHPRNRCFQADYRALLRQNGRGPEWMPAARADLVYMDPPYTADNYSRFYHVLETLASYHYPPLARDARGQATAGRYPEIAERFQSGFCRPAAVEEEFTRVIASSANSGSKLVLSYGAPNGLLLKVYRKRFRGADPVRRLRDLCRTRYRRVSTHRLALLHSGQGDSNVAAEELLLVCVDPR